MLTRCTLVGDEQKLASLMEQAWGCVGTLCRETKLHLSKDMLSEKSQQRRLQHMIDGAVLTEMIKDKHVKTVQDMVRAIQAGDRRLQVGVCAAENLPNRFDDMYEMITTVHVTEARVTDKEVLAAQASDPHCQQLKGIISGSEVRVGTEELYRPCKWQAPYHTVTTDGLLRRLLWKKGTKADRQIQEQKAPAVIPERATDLQVRLCRQVHEELGHASYLKVHNEMADRYIWTGMSAHILQANKKCTQCNYFGDRLPKAPIQGHVTAQEPAQRVMMDVIHLKELKGMKYVLTLVDVFSRWGIAMALPNIRANTVTNALRRYAIPSGMGRPGEFLIDGGSEFKGHLQAACEAWGSNWRPHTPHHSESERFNKTLESRIAHFSRQCNCSMVGCAAASSGSLQWFNTHGAVQKRSRILTSRDLVREKKQIQRRCHSRSA